VLRGEIQPRFSEPWRLGLYTSSPATLKLDGRTIVETERAARRLCEPIELEAGRRYPIEVSVTLGEKPGMLNLVWQSRTEELKHVPAAALYPNAAP
jgi:hypothetical protein